MQSVVQQDVIGLLVDYNGHPRIEIVKFASDLMDLPLKVLCELGGWKTAETVLQCYQRPDEDRLRKAIEEYRGGRSAAN